MKSKRPALIVWMVLSLAFQAMATQDPSVINLQNELATELQKEDAACEATTMENVGQKHEKELNKIDDAQQRQICHVDLYKASKFLCTEKVSMLDDQFQMLTEEGIKVILNGQGGLTSELAGLKVQQTLKDRIGTCKQTLLAGTDKTFAETQCKELKGLKGKLMKKKAKERIEEDAQSGEQRLMSHKLFI